jgi:hypothetical protein
MRYINKKWRITRPKCWIYGSDGSLTTDLKTVRDYHHFFRFERENMSMYEEMFEDTKGITSLQTPSTKEFGQGFPL